MGKKKKSKKNNITPSNPISVEEQTRLADLLVDLKSINLEKPREQITGPELALAFIERLPVDDPDAVPVISVIREHFKEKEVQKAVKKLIFRLKQRGISVPDSKDDTPILVWKPAENAEPTAYIGPFDATGNRGILVSIPQVPKGVNTGIGVVSSEEGIDQFIYVHYSKKQAKEIQELFSAQCGTVIETTIQHAASILEKAYLKTKQGDATKSYLQLRPWILEQGPILDHSIIHDFVTPESISSEVLTESLIDKLLDHEFMQSWLVDPDKMVPILEEISNVDESPILINEVQKSERIRGIKEKAVEGLFPEPRLLVMKDNLEEMAYFFYKLGEEEYARWSIVAASSLEQISTVLAANLFLMSLVDRSVEYYTQQMDAFTESEEEHEDSSSLILP